MKPTTDDLDTTPARSASRGRAVCSRASSFFHLLAFPLLAFAATLFTASTALASDELILEPDPPLLVGLIIGFVLLIFPSNQLIFKPIFKALDERAERIEGARGRATHIQSEADNVLADYESRIREARAEAETGRKAAITAARSEHGLTTSTARGEAETKIEQARATLANDLETARTQMGSEAQELARSAAEQILGRSLT